jgi:hypothetical protein
LPDEDFLGGFQRHARALVAGETEDWTVETSPADQVSGHMIAVYNGDNDVVALMTDLNGEPIAGKNGRDYVGDADWVGRSREG